MNRREFLQLTAAASATGAPRQRKKIAAIATTYFLRSHADDVITRELEGYWLCEDFHPPPFDVVSLYLDQTHPADVGRKLAMAHRFPVKPSIADALTLGANRLAVDGVVLVAEHGDYPFNDKQQQLYPRFKFFSQVVDVFKKSGRIVPVYCDKHLSYDWTEAKRMYDWSRELNFPLMAGSSVSVTFRRPEVDAPLDTEFEDALAVGSGWVTDGGIFHNLEVLQCFVERRKGGETGVRAVQHLSGDAVWRAAGQRVWSKDLLRAALSRAERPGKIARPEDVKDPVLCLVEYNDGFRGGALMLPGLVNEYLAAFRVKNRPEIQSTLLYVPPQNSNNFSMLVHGINQMLSGGPRPYPVERTLLTTGILSFLMESAYRGHKRIETPRLRVAYRGPENSFYAHGRGC
ncbi:MAG: hypothetical protein ABI165_16570 [Bryobacteraceae bacterium]